MKIAEGILVVYYSRTGNTERVAEDLGARLHADLERIEDKTKRDGIVGYLRAVYDSTRKAAADIAVPRKDAADYALTVIGTPVWAWNMTPAARAYIESIRGKARAMAFFVTSGDTDAARIVPHMEALAARRAVAYTGFNARELEDRTAYERKLSAFIGALQNRPR